MARKSSEPPGPKPRLIDRQNRVALPAEAMQALGVKAGDHVAFEVHGSEVRIHRVKWTLDKK
jgi:bifunctional DNA-binding transcriptional regulator/antitoxin component of YhaV-PrlF toxin-antitoxin module